MAPLRRSLPSLTLIALAVAVALLAGWTSPDWTIPFCERMGGRMELRPLADSSGGNMYYCVFADGTECSAREIRERTCKLPAAVAPSSPLAPSNADIPNISPLIGLPPWSLNELVEDAPLIVIGEVGPAQPIELFPYENGKPVTMDAFSSPLAGMPGTDFLLKVEQVVRDDGTIARGESVVLREFGEHTAALKKLTARTGYESTYTGDRYLFLLSPNPDEPDSRTYFFYHGVWSRLIVDGDILRISGGVLPPLMVAGRDEPITLDEFIQFVQSTDKLAQEKTLTAAANSMVQSYADAFGVSVEEAERRLILQDEMNGLEAKIRDGERTYAGSWMQHEPEFRLVVAFKSPDGEAIIQKYLEGIEWADLVVAQESPFTVEELDHIYDLVYTAAYATGIPFESGANYRSATIDFFTPQPEELLSRLQAVETLQPYWPHINIIYQRALSVPAGEDQPETPSLEWLVGLVKRLLLPD